MTNNKPLATLLFIFLCLYLIVVLPSSMALIEGYTAYWKLDEISGNGIIDSSGNGISGTLVNGPILVPGKVGDALDFNGVNNYVIISDTSSLSTNSFTIEVWVYPRQVSSTGNYQHIISKSTNPPVQGYCIEINPDGYFNFWSGDGSNADQLISPNKIIPNNWFFLVATYNGTTKSFYENGLPIDSYNAAINQANIPLEFGAMPNVGNYFNGIIDDVKFYNYALTPEQVTIEYATAQYLPTPTVNTPSIIQRPQNIATTTITQSAFPTNQSSNSTTSQNSVAAIELSPLTVLTALVAISSLTAIIVKVVQWWYRRKQELEFLSQIDKATSVVELNNIQNRLEYAKVRNDKLQFDVLKGRIQDHKRRFEEK